MEKMCMTCRQVLPMDRFSFAKIETGKRHAVCKTCATEKTKSLYYGRTEEERKIRRDYYHRNTETVKFRNWKNSLKKFFGISHDDYVKMYDLQGGCCAICKKHQSDLGKRLNVDHNHATGKVRGLLCWGCNSSIGKFNADVTTEILENALEYIKTREVIEYERD